MTTNQRLRGIKAHFRWLGTAIVQLENHLKREKLKNQKIPIGKSIVRYIIKHNNYIYDSVMGDYRTPTMLRQRALLIGLLINTTNLDKGSIGVCLHRTRLSVANLLKSHKKFLLDNDYRTLYLQNYAKLLEFIVSRGYGSILDPKESSDGATNFVGCAVSHSGHR